jgi:glycosyltransferase involved in cell wall biosynthesis
VPGPVVSVAVPAYNAERWIRETLESVVAQTMDDLEVVVVDDASTDGTREAMADVADPRIRLFRNERNLGQSANWNRTIALCRAPFVKLLCADDFLRADCLDLMLRPFRASETVGLVFCRREIVSEGDESEVAAWRAHYETMFRRFGELRELNSGRKLFEAYLATGFDDNWIGEPSAVMVRRSLFDRLPGFHPHVRQAVDMELWLRLLFHADVGFVDEPVATYRIVSGSVSSETARRGSRWLDQLWLVEALLADDEIRRAYPELRRLVRLERLKAVKELGRNLGGPRALADRLREARAYVSYLRRSQRPAQPRSAVPNTP